VLEDKDILQVDATIITGILIMLSITGFIGSGIGKTSFTGLASLVSIVLIPFSVSAVVQLERIKTSYGRRVKSISLTLMEFGFVALIFLFILYFLFPQIQSELHLK
jgi:hypothetical protein